MPRLQGKDPGGRFWKTAVEKLCMEKTGFPLMPSHLEDESCDITEAARFRKQRYKRNQAKSCQNQFEGNTLLSAIDNEGRDMVFSISRFSFKTPVSSIELYGFGQVT